MSNNKNTLVLSDEQLEVLKVILSIELYDYLSDDEIPVWQEIENKVNSIK